MKPIGWPMKFAFLTISTLLLLTSCGKEEEVPSGRRREFFETTYLNSPPTFLKMQNIGCGTSSFANSPLTFDLHLFFEGKLQTRTTDFNHLVSGLYIRHPRSIGRTVYKEKLDLLYVDDMIYGEKLSGPVDITLCPDETGYERFSVEGAALNTSYYINKTHEKFTSLVSDVNVSPITISISAEVTRSILENFGGRTYKNSRYLSDNAFYQPNTKTIYFLPHRNDNILYTKSKFWEIPMVASHEYGHHLFQSIYPESSSPNTVQACFPTITEMEGVSATKRNVQVQNIINAYNEAFADLVAYYSLDRKEGSIQGVKCLEGNRDVGIAQFYDGNAKTYSRRILDEYFSTVQYGDPILCQYPGYQTDHILGAIFAHQAHDLMSSFLDNDEEKLVTVVEWVQLLRKDRQSLTKLAPETYLRETIKMFVKLTLKKSEPTKHQILCSKAEVMFPGLTVEECSW